MKYCRKIALVLTALALVLSLGGCQKEAQAPADGPGAELAYPGTDWTMSPDQLKDALSLPAGSLAERETPADPDAGEEGQYALAVEDWEGFGASGSATFLFGEDAAAPGTYRLRLVQILLKSSADFQAVVDALTAQYGEPAEAQEETARWESETTIGAYLEDGADVLPEAEDPEDSAFTADAPLATIDLNSVNLGDYGYTLIFNGKLSTINNLVYSASET